MLGIACSGAQPLGTSDPPATLTSGWEFSFVPGASAADAPGAPGWKAWQPGTPLVERGGRNAVWLHVRVPARRWRSPTLFVEGVDTRMQAFLGGEPLVVRPAHQHRSGPLSEWTMVDLPLDAPGKLLALHVESDNPLDIGPFGRVAVGRSGDLLHEMIVGDAAPALVGIFALSVALLALVLFLRRREERSYLAFAIWAGSRGVIDLALTGTKQLVWNAPWFWERAFTVARLASPLALWATAHFLFGSGRRWRRAFRWMAAATAALAAVALLDIETLYRFISAPLNFQHLVCTLAALAIVVRSSLRANFEARVVLAGILAYVLAAVHDSLVALHYLPVAALWSRPAELLLIAAVSAVVLGRLGAVYSALSARAGDLERTNDRLSAAEASLTEAVRARDDFLSVASHELRTPLTSLQLQIQLVRRGKRDAAGALEVANRQTQRLAKLIEKLLDVSRVRGGALSLDPEPIDAAALARDVAAREEADAHRAGTALLVDAPEPLVGRWDRAALDQVLSNLLQNAIKYGAGKPVSVRAQREGASAVLVVQDHGIGIAPEDHQRIFERFERAASSRNYSGLGLGLWIAREIVSAHGGRLSVVSSPGSGATFRVELPLSDSTARRNA
jgi:signal transduction histidine kinase